MLVGLPSLGGSAASIRKLFTWGVGTNGVLGDGTTVTRSTLAQVGTATNWLVTANDMWGTSTYGILSDGTLWGWGLDTSSTLGDGASAANKSTPVQIGSATNWVAVACGARVTLAVTSTGQLWACGSNVNGDVGVGSVAAISTLVQVGALTNWTSNVSVGGCCSAIKSDGTLWTWGYNGTGQLGQGDLTNRSSPVQVGSSTNWAWTGQTATSGNAAINTLGQLFTWGYNNYGALGDGTTNARSSPVQVGSLTNWSKIWGGNYTHYAIKTDGTLWAWGYGLGGEVGDGGMVHRSSPVQVGSATNWTLAIGGNGTAVGLKSDGTLWAWGSTQSVTGVAANVSTPIQVGALTTWIGLSTDTQSGLAISSV